MKKNSESMALLITSFLLRYPDEEWFGSLEDVSALAEEMSTEIYSEPIIKFLEHTKQTGELNLAELYVKTFDFTKKTNLYMTYYLFEDQRERGAALLKLKRKYYEAGFVMEGNELPDFLPVILEFSTAAESKDILLDYIPVVKDIFKDLARDKNPYADVLKALLLLLKAEVDVPETYIKSDKTVDYVS